MLDDDKSKLQILLNDFFNEEIEDTKKNGNIHFLPVRDVEEAITNYLRDTEGVDMPEEFISEVLREIEENQDVTIEYTQYHEYQLSPNGEIPHGRQFYNV